MSEEREQDIGAHMSTEINMGLPIVQDSVLNAYVTTLGGDLAAVGDRPDLDYHFYLVNSAEANAFALPGGYIYVTRGLIESTHSTAELAAVLAHEIGHVAARHGVAKIERDLRTGTLVSFLYNTILGGEPRILRRNSLEITSALWTARHSRHDEIEADRLAVKYLVRAGIDPSAMIGLFESMDEEARADGGEDSGRLAAWFSSHPLTSTRIQKARAEIRREGDRQPVTRPPELAPYSAFLARVEELPPTIDLY